MSLDQALKLAHDPEVMALIKKMKQKPPKKYNALRKERLARRREKLGLTN